MQKSIYLFAVTTSPINNASVAVTSRTVTAQFNVAMNSVTINNSTFRVFDESGNALPATVSYTSTDKKATLTLTSNLLPNKQYKARLSSSIQSADGTNLPNDVEWNFDTISQPNVVPGNPAYPIIFIHGLDSNDETWNTTINWLAPTWGPLPTNNVFHAVLNAYGGDTTSIAGKDGVLGTNDDDVLFPSLTVDGSSVNQLSNGNLYSINFQNFWNRNRNSPRLIKYDHGTPGSGQSQSNQSSIYKQGYAVKKMIQAVLAATGAKKVILVGHSMGGLAAREYLQRQENGQHKWWIDPSAADGHKVAKLVTIGTPHLGSNSFNLLSKQDQTSKKAVPDLSSEAVRDLRYSYGSFDAWGPDPNRDVGVYLFGGSEALPSLVNQSYYNVDINCNGNTSDMIVGINDGNSNGRDNPSMPLPSDVAYMSRASTIPQVKGL